MLQHADDIKSANNDEFVEILKRLDGEQPPLTSAQQLRLRYLKAWQSAYRGDYATAVPQLDAVIAQSNDVTLKFRAGVTVVNVLSIASRNEEAFVRLSQLLELMPSVSDPDAREQGLAVAALLYNGAGQYDLALSYSNRQLAENADPKSFCTGSQQKLEALYRSGKLQTFNQQFQPGIDACKRAGEPIWANLIRVDVAKLHIAKGKYAEAIKVLDSNYDEIQHTRYPALVSAVDSVLAQAYWETGAIEPAQRYALSSVQDGVKNEYTESLVHAYQVLYLVAQKQGDYQAALAYHEKFAAADKGYLNDVSARVLAYQMVKQQVQEKKLQVDALSKQNQVLQLRQEISRKEAEARDLYLVMLMVVLGSIAFWAWRTKRSEIKFMQISRHDGLTGIFNRQHFVSVAEHALAQCKKTSQDASVILIDLDHFKAVNDTHGHAVGDQVLKCTVAACRAHLRANDLFGRLGGEEFGILMPDCVAATARQVAERIRSAVADCSGSEGGLDFPVRASFGISGTRTSTYGLRQLMIHADNALYQAKREGRDRVIVYDHTKAETNPLPPGVLDRRRG